MKERVTKFDMEAAFKALADIETPSVEGGIVSEFLVEDIQETKAADKTERLVEEYYDINSGEELEQAQAEREAEIAKAKLARIEKIVDLNAESEEDLLPTYVGKLIIQCPQCMTLFYKNEEDVVPSDEDETVVNVGEACQHCGNTDGYSLIGKVGEVKDDELANYEAAEDAVGEADEEDALNIDWDDIGLSEMPEGEEEATEEAVEEEPAEEKKADEEEPKEEEEATEEEKEEESEEKKSAKKEALSLESDATLLEAIDEADAEAIADIPENDDVSSSEVKALYASPEFQKPISDEEVRAALRNLGKAEKKESLNESDDELSWVEQTFINDALYYINKYGFYDVFGDNVSKKADRILAAFPKYIANKTKGKALGKELEVIDIEDEGLAGKRVKIKDFVVKEDLEDEEPVIEVEAEVEEAPAEEAPVEEVAEEPAAEEAPVEEEAIEEVPADFEGQMDFLAKDEQEAIDGYEAVIAQVEDEHVAAELEKIETEEQAHKDFLDAVKEDPTIEYVEPLDDSAKEKELPQEEAEIDVAIEEPVEEDTNVEDEEEIELESLSNIDENSLNRAITESLTDAEFILTNCEFSEDNKIIAEGLIRYSSEKLVPARYTFTSISKDGDNVYLSGLTESMGEEAKDFMLKAKVDDQRSLITESINYSNKNILAE